MQGKGLGKGKGKGLGTGARQLIDEQQRLH